MRSIPVILLLISLATACGGAVEPAPGESCDTSELHCESTTSLLQCVAGRWTAFPCRGSRGCEESSGTVGCDTSVAVANDACLPSAIGTTVCATDGRAALTCLGGIWQVSAPCSTCTSEGGDIVCLPPANESDAGANDGGVTDAGTNDGGVTDAGTNDGGVTDAGTNDGGTDAGVGDAGTGSTCADVPTSGRCQSSTRIEFCLVPTGNGAPTVATYDCPQGETCQVAAGTAQCVLTASCRDGESRCAGAAQLETCTQGAWTATTCGGSCTSSPLGSFCAPSVATSTISATVTYEARAPNSSRTDWGGVFTASAQGFLVVSYANGKVLDVAVTDDSGAFTLEVPASPSANDYVMVALAAGDGAGGIAYVVADPEFGSPGERSTSTIPMTPSAWAYGFPAVGVTNGATLHISEAMGSGAARIFDYLRYAHQFGRSQFGGASGRTLIVWIGFGTSWDCGACFAPWPVTAFGLQFESQMWIPADSNQSYWADPVTGHELGHWMMASYSTSPNEGGLHALGIPTFPGQAWSEGFATWFSSDLRQDSVYLDKQGGSMFWLDLAIRQYGVGALWRRPVPSGGLLQKIDENEVSAMLLELSTSSANASSQMYSAFGSAQMITAPWARGYTRHSWEFVNGQHQNVVDTNQSKPMFADFLDALNCSGFPRSAIEGAVDPASAYPYPVQSPICATNACAMSCNGCCIGGQCLDGTSPSACGTGGASCVSCAAGENCISGVCTGGTCNASTCPNGCCAGNACITATSASQCGTGGSACVACASNQVCGPAGTCALGGEGATCTQGAQCASGLCLLDLGSTTSGTCRNACIPNATSCGVGFNCIELNDGSGACVPAPAPTSRWHVVFYDAEMKALDPASGTAWDVGGGAPDVFVCGSFGASPAICTSTVSDSLTPQWNQMSTGTYSYSDFRSAQFSLWDEDLASDDLIDSFLESIQPPWAGQPWVFTFDHSGDPAAGSNSLTIVVYPQ